MVIVKRLYAVVPCPLHAMLAPGDRGHAAAATTASVAGRRVGWGAAPRDPSGRSPLASGGDAA